MARVVVYHAMYGCDTGCCGHVVVVGDDEQFEFAHPNVWPSRDLTEAKMRAFAEELVRDTFGEAHVRDLDWENCSIVDD